MNTNTSNNTDAVKAAQLRQHKAWATGLFLLMVAIYAFCTWYMKSHSVAWIGYVKAFAEAAMVGALADWFAVTALFHHPLGIPIPHTNLIENSKKRIGDNLGGFVVSNFLNSQTIRPYIQKLNASQLIIQWLTKEKNIDVLVTEISRLLKDILQRADDKMIVSYITRQSQNLLNDLQLNTIAAQGLEMVMHRGDLTKILDYLIEKIRIYVTSNEEMIKDRVKQESHFLIPGFVDNIIASKITKGLYGYLSEIEKDKNHKIRIDLDTQINKFIEDLKTNPKWHQELQRIKDSLLSGDRIQQYAGTIWKNIQGSMINDLADQFSSIQQYFKKTILEMLHNLEQDEAMQQKINKWVQWNVYKYTLRNTEKVGDLISDTVGNWEGKELSQKLELEVGKDLQFIRINGTLVGGLVGLLIYTITRLFI